jgi:hypothetical protein
MNLHIGCVESSINKLFLRSSRILVGCDTVSRRGRILHTTSLQGDLSRYHREMLKSRKLFLGKVKVKLSLCLTKCHAMKTCPVHT